MLKHVAAIGMLTIVSSALAGHENLGRLLIDDPVAVVLDVQGDVTSTAGPETNLVRRQQVEAGELRLDSGASLLVALMSTGEMQRLTAAGNPIKVMLSAAGASEANGLQIKTIPGKIPANSLEKLSPQSRSGVGQARGAFDPPGPVVHPIHDSVVFDVHPKLSWPKLDGIEEYRVVVYRPGNQRPLFKQTTTETEIQISKKLPPGTYEWSVNGLVAGADDQEIAAYVDGDGKPKCFEVADSAQIERRDSILKLKASTTDEAGMLEVIADLLNNERDYEQAIELFEKLHSTDPQNVAIPVELYELYGRSGRAAEAGRMRATAESLGYSFDAAKK